METYKRSLQSLIKWIILGLLLSLCVTIGLYIYSQKTMNQAHINDFVHGVQTGISAGLFVGLIRGAFKIKKILKDESSLKKEYIKSRDERTQFIFSKMGTTSFYVEMFVLLLGIIVSGFFNEIVTITLLAVLAVKIILKITLKTYYEKTY